MSSSHTSGGGKGVFNSRVLPYNVIGLLFILDCNFLTSDNFFEIQVKVSRLQKKSIKYILSVHTSFYRFKDLAVTLPDRFNLAKSSLVPLKGLNLLIFKVSVSMSITEMPGFIPKVTLKKKLVLRDLKP